jgi:hypothetical protein
MKRSETSRAGRPVVPGRPKGLSMGLLGLHLRLQTALLRGAGHDHKERGDVPGWVMITLMSAVLVAALLAIATPALEGLFNQAMDRVGN